MRRVVGKFPENITEYYKLVNIWIKRNIKLFKSKIMKLSKSKKVRAIFIIILSLFFLFILILAIFSYDLYKRGKELELNLKSYSAAIIERDINKAHVELEKSNNSLNNLKDSYQRTTFVRSIPFIGNYYRDGEAVINASFNFLEVLNIVTGSLVINTGNTNTSSSTIDQMLYIVNSSPNIASSSAEINLEIAKAQGILEEVNPEDYPDKLFGKNLRLHIQDLLKSVDNISFFLTNGNDLMGLLPNVAGFDGERKYLIIFQNNKELRPTGGFITAYTIAKVSDGKLQIEDSSDIYELDERYTPSIPAPTPIIKNLQGPYAEDENYRLRDMNWDPDFPTSMELFLNEIQSVGINDIDGVIAVDTQVLVDVIDVIGEINVPGYGGYSNNIVELCDCEQIIYELEHFADREGPIVWSENEPGKIVHAPDNYNDRKKIIGPMMNTIMENVFNLRKTKYPALLNAVTKDLKEKHILLYLLNDSEQNGIEKMGAGGNIEDVKIDYLHINDSNLGGKKANLYVTHQVDQKVEVDDGGSVTRTIELTYKNPKPQNNWLNTVLPNYVRVYVPQGSELIEFDGLDYSEETYLEQGKTVFAGLLTVRPMGVTKVSLKYKLPFKVEHRYNLYLQKQPGKNAPKYSIDFGADKVEFNLNTDKEVSIQLN